MNSIQQHGLALAGAAFILLTLPPRAYSQTFDTVGTRAAGMGGAFVAVADDASASYWNPGGFASGSYFSVVLDYKSGSTDPAVPLAGSGSGALLALGTPALGVSYYRLRQTTLGPPLLVPATDGLSGNRNIDGVADVRARSLVTHHLGATLVQSLMPGVSVGTTLKIVRGIASSENRAGNREELLDDAAAMTGRASNEFDADIGVMAAFPYFKAGVTIRNVREPQFETPDGIEVLELQRLARAGVSFLAVPGWTVAADFDLLRAKGVSGEVRDVALGVEGRVHRRFFVRSGFTVNTLDDGGERAKSYAFGASVAVMGGILVDAQITGGSDRSATGWGISGRFVY